MSLDLKQLSAKIVTADQNWYSNVNNSINVSSIHTNLLYMVQTSIKMQRDVEMAVPKATETR